MSTICEIHPPPIEIIFYLEKWEIATSLPISYFAILQILMCSLEFVRNFRMKWHIT